MVPGDRVPVLRHVVRRPGGDDVPAGAAGARPDVDQVVGRPQHVQVVFDDQHRVAQIAQAAEHCDQVLGVGRVQADGGLVEDVQHAGESGAEQGGQAQALRVTRRQARRRLVEGQVADADVDEPAYALPEVGDDRLGDQPFLR